MYCSILLLLAKKEAFFQHLFAYFCLKWITIVEKTGFVPIAIYLSS